LYVFTQGALEDKGTYVELCESGIDFAKKLALESEQHEEKDKLITESIQSPTRRRVRSISETSTVVSGKQISCFLYMVNIFFEL
jgi:hypothetical protein